MFRGLRIFLVLLSCLHLCAGVTGLFQVFAWSRMLVDYSTSAGLAEGVSMTFDGQHPCRLCKVLAANRRQQKDPQQESPALTAMRFALENLLPAEAVEAMRPAPVEFILPEFVPTEAGRSIAAASPPVPPPRGFWA